MFLRRRSSQATQPGPSNPSTGRPPESSQAGEKPSLSPVALDPKGPLPDSVAIPAATYAPMQIAVERTGFCAQPGEIDFYPGPMVGAEALGAKFVESGSGYIRAAYELTQKLSPDDYLRYLMRYYEAGLA